jgi:tRNA(adenine34) deaminase
MDEGKLREGMDQALELARKAASEDEVPVGALVLDPEGRIIGSGYNRREQDHDPCSHAEIHAIQAAARHLQSWRLTECTLIVTLEPCPMCLAASQQARLKQVIYAATDPKGGALSLGYRFHEDPRTHHRFLVRQLETPACGEILSEFFRKKRRSSSESDSSPAPSSQ